MTCRLPKLPIVILAVSLCFAQFAFAIPTKLGDLDEDGSPTVADLVLLNNHVNGSAPLDSTLDFFADLNEDGAINQADVALLLNAVSGRSTLPNPGAAPRVSPPPISTGDSSVTITGRTVPNSDVNVAGGTAIATGTADANGNFSIEVNLNPNRMNRLAVSRVSAGILLPARYVEVTNDTQPPTIHIDFPADGATLTTDTVDVAGRVADLLSGYQGLDVTVNGDAAVVIVGIGTNGTFERGGIPLVLGDNDITATATDVHGNEASITITVTRVQTEGPQILAVSGNGQNAEMHQFLTDPVIIQAFDAVGDPLVDKLIDFEVIRSDGRLFATLPTTVGAVGAMKVRVRTDASGLARAYWQLGADAGCGNNRLRVSSAGVQYPAFFCASTDAGPANQINVGMGSNQRTAINAPALEPLKAWVNDMCNGISGIDVTFTVTAGGGKVNGADSATVVTSTTGHAEVVFTAGPVAGVNVVDANFPGNQNASARFVIQAVGSNGRATTTFSGVILNNANQGIGGAGVELKVNGVSIAPTISNVDGTFEFSDIPSGPADLYIHTDTITTVGGAPLPDDDRYPHMHYETMVVADADNSLATPVYLPVLKAVNDHAYDPSSDEDLELTVDGLEGMKFTIKAGSMRLPDGSVPTDPVTVAVNPVHVDEIPMPLPDGTFSPFAWTFQPGGYHYDPPVQITYPNMAGLPAGAVAYFLSFNHDTNQFEIVASGTVSNDGSEVITDPGVGIATSGWGGNCPPYPVTGDVENCNTECTDNGSLSGGSATAAQTEPVCVRTPISFTVTDPSTDTGGMKRRQCEDQPPENIPIQPVTPTYTWTIKRDGTAVKSGTGTVASHTPQMGGMFTAEFTAMAERDCPPSTINFSADRAITVVSVNGITFSPEFLKPGMAGTAQATAMTFPEGEEVIWSIEEPVNGFTINETTGQIMITAATPAGQPVVKAELKNFPGCSTTASFCIGESKESCCPDYSGSKSFGPVTVTFGQNITSFGNTIPASLKDLVSGNPQEVCSYQASGSGALASVEIATVAGLFPAKSATLTPPDAAANFSIVWAEKDQTLIAAKIIWKGSKDLGKFGPVTGKLIEASLGINSGGQLSGKLLFEAELTEEVSVHDIAFLQPDLTGQFSYNFNNTGSFSGEFNFEGIQNIEVHLKKGSKLLARGTATNLDKDGNLKNVLLALESDPTFTSNAFTAKLSQLDVRFDFSLSTGEMDFKSGTGAIEVTNIRNVEGKVTLRLMITKTSIMATVELEEVKVFDTSITGELSTTINFALDVNSIMGSNISFKHEKFDQAITNVNFEIKNGELEKFSVGNVTLKYDGGIEFMVSDVLYEKATSKLKLTADVMVPRVTLKVEDFEIARDGMISVGRVKSTIMTDTFFVDIDIRFGDNQYAGKVQGSFGGTIDISLDVIVGADPAGFNYGSFAFRLRVQSGVPIGQSGLKVTTLSGEFGYNYNPATFDASGVQTAPGSPQQGTVFVGFGIGISDIGNLASLETSVRAVLPSGGGLLITLTGTIKVTANSPHYFTGALTVTNYRVGTTEIMGSLASTVKIPPDSGKIVSLNSGSINFAIKNSRWSITAPSMSGELFEAVTITANVDLAAPLRSPFNMTGSLGGTLSYSNNFSFAFPEGFNPATCQTAIDTDTYGFGVSGNIAFSLSGGFNANLNRNGVSGCISVSTSGNGSIDYKLPCTFCGDNCVGTASASFSGDLRICRRGNATELTGNVTVNIPGITSREVGVDLTI